MKTIREVLTGLAVGITVGGVFSALQVILFEVLT